MSKISRFTSKAVTLAKNVVGDRGDFADYALVSLHCLRVYLDESYRNALDLLSEMPHIRGEIGLEEGDFPDHSTLVKAFDSFDMKVWRVLLRLSSELQDLSGHAAIDASLSTVRTPVSTTAAGRIIAFKHWKRPLSSIQKLKRSSTFTVRPRKRTIHSSAGRSPAATQATCTASPLTKLGLDEFTRENPRRGRETAD